LNLGSHIGTPLLCIGKWYRPSSRLYCDSCSKNPDEFPLTRCCVDAITPRHLSFLSNGRPNVPGNPTIRCILIPGVFPAGISHRPIPAHTPIPVLVFVRLPLALGPPVPPAQTCFRETKAHHLASHSCNFSPFSLPTNAPRRLRKPSVAFQTGAILPSSSPFPFLPARSPFIFLEQGPSYSLRQPQIKRHESRPLTPPSRFKVTTLPPRRGKNVCDIVRANPSGYARRVSRTNQLLTITPPARASQASLPPILFWITIEEHLLRRMALTKFSIL